MMKVEVISSELVKPSSPTPSHLKTFKISLMDQLLVSDYIPFIFHYPITDPNCDTNQLVLHLKNSLSDTLTRFYPLAGRFKDHMSVDCNDEGVLFIETRVNCSMSEFLNEPQIEQLHQFVFFIEMGSEPETSLCQLAVQVNVFASDGIAIGVSMLHKMMDGSTLATFLKCWAAIASDDSQGKAIFPDLTVASSLFPPRSDQLPRSMSFLKDTWVKKGKSILRRFLFDDAAIKALKAKASSRAVPNPSSSLAVSAFIWKCAVAASRKVKGIQSGQIATILAYAVNMRSRMVPPAPELSMGNIFWLATATQRDGAGLEEMVGSVREAVGKLDREYAQKMRGEEGFHQICKLMEERDELYAKEKPEVYMVSDLRSFRFSELDFGWGKPTWVSNSWGFSSPVFVNGVFLGESHEGGGIEAWVHLEGDEMRVFEHDPELLSFAKLNPGIPL
ncbi:stemmadenine O-acetyltransferase-like [Diospyros lotus]|uniref:stemmadenine O-acetyltransferase-like n=1 Tax=Diospyros lotus TaxID=55363 RepID=UPI002254360C|nr:stemmadenine O-acetyltransferase-like [Diospyros lotus]